MFVFVGVSASNIVYDSKLSDLCMARLKTEEKNPVTDINLSPLSSDQF